MTPSTPKLPDLLQLALDALNSGNVLQRTRAVVELESALAAQPPAVAAIPEGYDMEAVDEVTVAITHDEGDDDSVKVLRRVAEALKGRSFWQLLEYVEELKRAQPPAGQQDRGEAPGGQPSDAGFQIVSAWLQQEGKSANGDQLFTMCRFADFVLSRAPATSGEATAAQGAWRSMSSAPTSRPIILLWRTAPWPLRGEWSIDEEFDTRPKGWVSPESGWRNDGDQCIPRNQEDCIGWQKLPPVPSGNGGVE